MSSRRVVASLTTMPDKYKKLIETLRSLANQTRTLDAIYVGVPEKSKRLDIPYPDINLPEDLQGKVTIVRLLEDWGPICKIAAGLYQEQDPETVIITFDDDMQYPKDMVEKLLHCNKRFPNRAIGSAGMLIGTIKSCPFCAINPNENVFPFSMPKFPIGKNGRRIDVIYGYPGALYLRKFFPVKDKLQEEFFSFSKVNFECFINDDVTISGYLSLKGIERRIFKNMPEVGFVLDENGKRNQMQSEISYDMDKFFRRMNVAIDSMVKKGCYSKTEPLNANETLFGMGCCIVISALIIFFLALYYFYM